MGLAIAGAACGDPEHPPLADFGPAVPPRGGEGGSGGAIVVDLPSASGGMAPCSDQPPRPPACGGVTIPAILVPPKLYFVLDRSGSMGEPLVEGGDSKYAEARTAVAMLLRAVGHRVEYGAAVFPASPQSSNCEAGHQVFGLTPGDAKPCNPGDPNGPHLEDLLLRLGARETGGATPTAATLAALAPTIGAFGEHTYVLLFTDGAPNCNEAMLCESSECIPDIERADVGAGVCGVDFSCCDPEIAGEDAGANCIDRDSELELAALHEAGVVTYVVGMPGSEAYATLLDRLAEAGGGARSASPAYYAIADTEALVEALFEIGTGLAIDCAIELESEPEEPDLVNVYFDGEAVAYDPDDGWEWTSPQGLELRGAACLRLGSGAVAEVEVVYGCETVVPE